jgi:hypothetical protein
MDKIKMCETLHRGKDVEQLEHSYGAVEYKVIQNYFGGEKEVFSGGRGIWFWQCRV